MHSNVVIYIYDVFNISFFVCFTYCYNCTITTVTSCVSKKKSSIKTRIEKKTAQLNDINYESLVYISMKTCRVAEVDRKTENCLQMKM